MPKKFVGENSKAVAARARKENDKQEKDMKTKKMAEDAEWVDNDDKLKKKQQKKVRFWLFLVFSLINSLKQVKFYITIHRTIKKRSVLSSFRKKQRQRLYWRKKWTLLKLLRQPHLHQRLLEQISTR